jgi:DNA-binding ferritin-like protein
MEVEIIHVTNSTENPTDSVQSTLDPVRQLGLIFLKSVSFVHMLHWYVLDHNIHKILGDLYEDLDELFDKLEEEIIGCTRYNTAAFPFFNSSINLDDISQYSGDPQNIINLYFSLYNEITSILTSLEFKNYINQVKSGIPNTIDDIVSRLNKANYLLSLVRL